VWNFSLNSVFDVLFYNSEKLNLLNAEEYKYLRQSNCYSISGVDDAEEFRIVKVYTLFTYICIDIGLYMIFYSFHLDLWLKSEKIAWHT